MASKKENLSAFPYLSPFQIILFEILKEHGPMTRDQICEKFGYKKRKVIQTDKYLLRKRGLHIRNEYERYDQRSTIYYNLVKLQKRKLVEKFSKNNGERGRPKIFFKLKGG